MHHPWIPVIWFSYIILDVSNRLPAAHSSIKYYDDRWYRLGYTRLHYRSLSGAECWRSLGDGSVVTMVTPPHSEPEVRTPTPASWERSSYLFYCCFGYPAKEPWLILVWPFKVTQPLTVHSSVEVSVSDEWLVILPSFAYSSLDFILVPGRSLYLHEDVFCLWKHAHSSHLLIPCFPTWARGHLISIIISWTKH